MRLVLDLSVNSAEEAAEAQMYAEALQRMVERKQWQSFPGAMLELGDGSVWVARVSLEPANPVTNPEQKVRLRLVKDLDTEPGSA